MENLILSFNVVLPLFLCIALGYCLRLMNMLEETTQKSLNKLCFKVFLPIHLFNSIYTTNISAAFNGLLVELTVVGVLALFVGLMVFIPKIEHDDAKRGVMIQAIFRSNYALFGLPVVSSLCGDDKVGPASLLISLIVPLFNVLAVICLETFRGGKPDVKKMLIGIAKNPLIIGSVLGILANVLDIPIPAGVHKGIIDLGRVATPLALVALGAGFQFRRISGYTRQLFICITGRLVAAPLLMLTIAALLGLREELLAPVLAVFGSPVATSSYTMAEQMNGDGTLAASLVVLTTALAILTVFLFIFGMKQLGLV